MSACVCVFFKECDTECVCERVCVWSASLGWQLAAMTPAAPTVASHQTDPAGQT